MNYIEHRFSLVVEKTVSQTAVKVKRGDTINRLIINLTDHGYPYHISEEVRAFFVDGAIMNACTIDNCSIIYDLTTQTVGTVGRHQAEIRLVGHNDEVITTAKFTIIVENTIYDDNQTETVPQNSVDALTGLISEAAQLIDEVNESLENGDFVGEKGDEGKSAYEVAVEEGFKGTEAEWLESLKADTTEVEALTARAEMATERAESAADNAENVSDRLKVYVENNFANAFVGNAEGAVVTVDDVSPIEHAVKCKVEGVNVSESTSVKVYGKNLFSSEERVVADFGGHYNTTIRNIEENKIYVGLSPNNYYGSVYVNSYDVSNPREITINLKNVTSYGLGFSYKVKPGDTYTLSVSERPIGNSRLALSFYSREGNHLSYVVTPTSSEVKCVTATVPDNAGWMIAILVSAVTDTDITFKDAQLELRDTATEFEEYKPHQSYAAGEDGTVEGMVSISPYMTVLSDAAGAIVEIEYNRDSNKVIEELYSLLAQGGMAKPDKHVNINMFANAWVDTGSGVRFTQTVAVEGLTPTSQINLKMTGEQLEMFYDINVTITVDNINGVAIASAIGERPTEDITIQATIKEVDK